MAHNFLQIVSKLGSALEVLNNLDADWADGTLDIVYIGRLHSSKTMHDLYIPQLVVSRAGLSTDVCRFLPRFGSPLCVHYCLFFIASVEQAVAVAVAFRFSASSLVED